MVFLYSEEPIEFTSFDDIQKYRRTQKIRYICSECHQETIQLRINVSEDLICSKCKRKHTFENFDWSERNRKSEETKLEKYGDAHYTNVEKIRATWEKKTDDEINAIYQKTAETNQRLYNGHPAKRQEQKDRTKVTCQIRFGVDAPAQSEMVKEKFRKTCMTEFGVENPFQSEEVKEKIKRTNLERRGVENPRLDPNVDKAIKETCLKKYNSEHPWSNNDVRKKCFQRYIYDDIHFDSSWELYLYIYLIEQNIEFEYQPDIYFTYLDTYRYFPDFMIDGVYYEIKGEQFFDENDNMINPYNREEDYIYESKHQCMISNNIIILRKVDLEKVFKYIDNKYTVDYIKLFKTDYSINDKFDEICKNKVLLKSLALKSLDKFNKCDVNCMSIIINEYLDNKPNNN